MLQNKRRLKTLEEGGWIISPEGIHAYQENIVPKLYFSGNTSFLSVDDFTGAYSALATVVEEYIAKGLTKENITAFIKDLDQVVVTVLLEEQRP